MGEWFSEIFSAPWAPAAAAYIFGLATGWLIWSGGKTKSVDVFNGDGTRADEKPLLIESAQEEEKPATTMRADADMIEQSPGASSDASSSSEAKAEDATNGDDPCPATMKLGAVESELRRARELLATAQANEQDLTEEITTLDAALKRANGRLKLLLKSVKRAKPGS